MFFSVFDPDPAAAPSAPFTWVTGSSLVDVEDGVPGDGDRVTLLTDAGGVADAEQTTAGSRPVWRPGDFPGRGGIEYTLARHLTVDLPIGVGTAVVICTPGSGTRGLLSRDTSATTDKPAFRLTVSEDFG